MTSLENDMDWNIVCKFNSKYRPKRKIANIKEGFLVDHFGGLEEISRITQTWVQDLTSPSFMEQKTMCTVSDKVTFKPSAPIQPTTIPHSVQAYVCPLYAPNRARFNAMDGNINYPVLISSHPLNFEQRKYNTTFPIERTVSEQ
jgi:hypothetical protein